MDLSNHSVFCVCACVLYADMMMNMGYSRKDIEESLIQQKYNDIMATYFLLARRGSDVSCCSSSAFLTNKAVVSTLIGRLALAPVETTI